MNNSQHTPDAWVPCPPGTLSTLAGQEHRRRRRQFLMTAGSVAGAGLLTAGAAWLVAFRDDESHPAWGGIACARVQSLAPRYLANQLEPDVREQIAAHLERCEICRDELAALRRGSQAATDSDRAASATCNCPPCRQRELQRRLRARGPEVIASRAVCRRKIRRV